MFRLNNHIVFIKCSAVPKIKISNNWKEIADNQGFTTLKKKLDRIRNKAVSCQDKNVICS